METMLLGFSPGLLGGMLSLFIAELDGGRCASKRLIFFGAGGIFGYLFLAAVIRVLDTIGAKSLSIEAFYLAVGIAFSILFLLARPHICGWRRARWRFLLGSRGCSGFAVRLTGTLAVLYILPATYLSFITPVSGWDALGLWTEWAKLFLDFDQSHVEYFGRARSAGEPFPEVHPRHPLALVYLNAFSAFVSSESGGYSGWLMPSLFIWLCLISVLLGFVRFATDSWSCAFLACIFGNTIPLFENHVVLAGYADFWVAVISCVAAALISIGLSRSAIWCTVAGFLFIFSTLLFKGNAFMYVVAFFAALLFLDKRYLIFGLSAFSAAASVFLLFFPFDRVASCNIEKSFFIDFCQGAQLVIRYGDYNLELGQPQLLPILKNTLWALFVNQSYSIWPCLYVISCFYLATSACSERLDRGLVYLSALVVTLLFIFAVPQAFGDYALVYAAIGNDTGNSRFLLVIGHLCLLVTVITFSNLQRASSKHVYRADC